MKPFGLTKKTYSTESSESPSQITRLIVADNVSQFLGIASRISITCAQCDERKYIEPVICKSKEGNYEKGNQSEHFAINIMFVLGCHEAGMSPYLYIDHTPKSSNDSI